MSNSLFSAFTSEVTRSSLINSENVQGKNHITANNHLQNFDPAKLMVQLAIESGSSAMIKQGATARNPYSENTNYSAHHFSPAIIQGHPAFPF